MAFCSLVYWDANCFMSCETCWLSVCSGLSLDALETTLATCSEDKGWLDFTLAHVFES